MTFTVREGCEVDRSWERYNEKKLKKRYRHRQLFSYELVCSAVVEGGRTGVAESETAYTVVMYTL